MDPNQVPPQYCDTSDICYRIPAWTSWIVSFPFRLQSLSLWVWCTKTDSSKHMVHSRPGTTSKLRGELAFRFDLQLIRYSYSYKGRSFWHNSFYYQQSILCSHSSLAYFSGVFYHSVPSLPNLLFAFSLHLCSTVLRVGLCGSYQWGRRYFGTYHSQQFPGASNTCTHPLAEQRFPETSTMLPNVGLDNGFCFFSDFHAHWPHCKLYWRHFWAPAACNHCQSSS